ncbi:hypothetical protein R9C00_10825 [Flammeovirgaceae bacterium SG7u.111]|nr:hypothetical protein [Flammeovirgaceae bacterium SG7u.132]WPO37945.1 hypothetical protein R9C00_10825 [Flammeovirgaceae bacterium SG7u.111]
MLIKASIIEKYIKSERGIKRSGIETVLIETRFFSSMDKFHEWYDTFKEQLWEDNQEKVDKVEGVYVKTEELTIDDVNAPSKINQYATFRPGVSYRYAN